LDAKLTEKLDKGSQGTRMSQIIRSVRNSQSTDAIVAKTALTFFNKG